MTTAMAGDGGKKRSAVIVQVIGSLRRYSKLRFITPDRKATETTLAATAVLRFLEEEISNGIRLVFLVPESLVESMGEVDLADVSEFESTAKEAIAASFEDVGNFEVVHLPSIGVYGDGRYVFRNSYGNIVLSVFTRLLKMVAGGRGIDLYFVTTTGLNIYVTAVLDALRALIVYKKLESILQEGEYDFSVKLVAHEPVIGRGASEEHEIRIEFVDYDVKAFFSYPLKGFPSLSDLLASEGELREVIGSREVRETYQRLKRTLSLARAFNAVKYNVPLAFRYPKEILGIEEDREEKLDHAMELIARLAEMVMGRTVKEKDGAIEVFYRDTNHKVFLNLFLTQALGKSIVKALKEAKEAFEVWSDLVCADSLRAFFESLYTRVGLGLNARFLARDLEEIEAIAESMNLREGEIRLLKEREESGEKSHMSAYPEEGGRNQAGRDSRKKVSDIKRNFFAHSGMLYDITYVGKHGGKLYVGWNLSGNWKRMICGWLSNPEE